MVSRKCQVKEGQSSKNGTDEKKRKAKGEAKVTARRKEEKEEENGKEKEEKEETEEKEEREEREEDKEQKEKNKGKDESGKAEKEGKRQQQSVQGEATRVGTHHVEEMSLKMVTDQTREVHQRMIERSKASPAIPFQQGRGREESSLPS